MAQCSRQVSALMEKILQLRFTDQEQELQHCLALQQLAQQEEDPYALTFVQLYLGDCYVAQNDPQSYEHLRTALEGAKAYHFPDLEMKAHHLMGIYCDLAFDGQSCAAHWMEALDLARELGDRLEEGILLHNLGDMFKLRSDYQEALRYLQESLACLTPEITREDSRYAISLLLNLAEVSLRLGCLEEMGHYLRQCEALEIPPARSCAQAAASFHRFALSVGWCAFYAACEDVPRAVALAEKSLRSSALQTADKTLVFDFLVLVLEAMLRVDATALMRQLLALLKELCPYGGIGAVLQYGALQVDCARRFGTPDDLAQAYCIFYETVQQNAQTELASRAEGLKTKISLHRAKREREQILQMSRRLEDEAYLDELTGIFNRRYFQRLCVKLVAGRAANCCGIVIVDMDYFKEYNDYYGHAGGDKMLRAVAQAMREDSDPRITACRYGGDEFVSLCMNMEDREIEDYIQRFRYRLQELHLPHQRSRCAQEITVSIGYSSAPVFWGWDMAHQWEQADRALYRSKAKGRNCWTKG